MCTCVYVCKVIIIVNSYKNPFNRYRGSNHLISYVNNILSSKTNGFGLADHPIPSPLSNMHMQGSLFYVGVSVEGVFSAVVFTHMCIVYSTVAAEMDAMDHSPVFSCISPFKKSDDVYLGGQNYKQDDRALHSRDACHGKG